MARDIFSVWEQRRMFVVCVVATIRPAKDAMVFPTAARSWTLVACAVAMESRVLDVMENRKVGRSLTRAACAGATTPPAPAATACPTG